MGEKSEPASELFSAPSCSQGRKKDRTAQLWLQAASATTTTHSHQLEVLFHVLHHRFQILCFFFLFDFVFLKLFFKLPHP